MSAKFKYIAPVLLFLFFSCVEERRFPPLNSEKTSLAQVTLNGTFVAAERAQTLPPIVAEDVADALGKLEKYKEYYTERSDKFDLKTFEQEWKAVRQKIVASNLNFDQLKSWVKINGFLIELTGDPKYAAEMERLILSGTGSDLTTQDETEKLMAPYVFTRDLDNVFINLFVNSTLEFEHSLFGTVKIEQKIDPSNPENVRVAFSLAEKKYMEVNIRIPEWAHQATVTVKKVKYVANPGTYCKIAKKWKEGDVVEIDFGSAMTETK